MQKFLVLLAYEIYCHSMGRLHSNLHLLGITGTIGSGKSTAMKYLESMGALPISSDQLARSYTEKDSPIRKEIRVLFGEESFPEGEAANRGLIASIAFRDPEKKRSLESLIHPRVRQDFLDLVREWSYTYITESKIVAWEVPLLFETDSYTLCDSTLTIYVSREIAWKRVESRGGIPRVDFENRWNSQMDIEKKKSLSDYTIPNDNSKEELEKKLKELWENLR